jgi:hypothetical protein
VPASGVSGPDWTLSVSGARRPAHDLRRHRRAALAL